MCIKFLILFFMVPLQGDISRHMNCILGTRYETSDVQQDLQILCLFFTSLGRLELDFHHMTQVQPT
jgi:hypothetical protein